MRSTCPAMAARRRSVGDGSARRSGGGRAGLHGRGGDRFGASRRPFARRRDRDADRARIVRSASTALTLIAPGGLRRGDLERIHRGLHRRDRARKLRPVLEMLVANPEHGDGRHGRGGAEVQTPRRRDRRRCERSPTRIFRRQAARLAARPARRARRCRCRSSGARPTASCRPSHADGLPANDRRSRASPAPATSRTWKRRRR